MAYTFSEEELKEIYVFALDLGRRAGMILLDGVEKRTGEVGGRGLGSVEEKMNAVDIVTQTDLGLCWFFCAGMSCGGLGETIADSRLCRRRSLCAC